MEATAPNFALFLYAVDGLVSRRFSYNQPPQAYAKVAVFKKLIVGSVLGITATRVITPSKGYIHRNVANLRIKQIVCTLL